MSFETVIFDLDGTLLDTLDDLADACNYALRSVGLPERSREEVRAFVGNGMARLMELAVPGGHGNPRYEAALSTIQTYYKAHNQVKTGSYEGIMSLLQQLKDRGAAIAVVSNKPDTSVKPLAAHYFPGMFPVAIGERSGVRRKPAPDSVFEALKELDKPKETALYVGDSEVDIATARNAGIPCVAVTWGFRSRETLVENGAEMFADTPEDVLKWL